MHARIEIKFSIIVVANPIGNRTGLMALKLGRLFYSIELLSSFGIPMVEYRNNIDSDVVVCIILFFDQIRVINLFVSMKLNLRREIIAVLLFFTGGLRGFNIIQLY